MNTKGLSNQEVFDKLREMLDNGDIVTYEDLKECVSTRSVVDPIAKDDALTVFFSGEDDAFIKNLSSGNNSNIRIIRRTEASRFLADDEFEDLLDAIIHINNQKRLIMMICLKKLRTSGSTIPVHMREKQEQVFGMKYPVNLLRIQKGMPILYVRQRVIRGFSKWKNCQPGLRMQQMMLRWEDIQKLQRFYIFLKKEMMQLNVRFTYRIKMKRREEQWLILTNLYQKERREVF